MSKNNTSLIESSPFRFLFLLVPFVIAGILGICTMGAGDTSLCLWWAVFLLLLGFVTLPLSARLWENFSSGGFFLSQPLGLVLTCLVLWTLTHLKLCYSEQKKNPQREGSQRLSPLSLKLLTTVTRRKACSST